jgi:hypothetical protein
MTSKFDYVRYDKESNELQSAAKELVIELDAFIEQKLGKGRYQALAVTDLEKCYAWIGKAIRDRQIYLNGTVPLQEERTNS